MSCMVSDSKDIGSGFRSQPDGICDFQIFPHLVLKLYFTLDQSLMDICTKPSPRIPWWLSDKESACQCRRHCRNDAEFDPWSGKIKHAVEQLSPCATTTEPVL